MATMANPDQEPVALATGAAESGPRKQYTSDFIDLGAIWLAFRRRLWLFLIVFAAIAAAVLVAYLLQQRIYAAQAEVMVNTSQEQVTGTQAVIESQKPDNFAVETEVEVLQSPALARRVVEKLKLWANPRFMGPSDTPMTQQDAIAQATGMLQSQLSVKRSGLAFVIDVVYLSPDPQLATTIVNALVQEYMDNQLEIKLEATQRASGFLGGKLAGLKAKAETADAALASFQAAHPMLTSGEDQTIVQSEMSTMNGDLASAQADLAQLRGALGNARSGIAQDANGTVGSSASRSAITELRTQEADAARKVADLQSRYGDRHPELLAAKSQLDTIRTQIRAETRRNIVDLEGQVQAAQQRVASIQASRGQTSGVLATNNRAKAQLETLQREAQTAGATYEQYLQRFRDTSSQEGSQYADSRILALAQVPGSPIRPSLGLFLAIAVLGGALGGAIAVTGRELLERGMRTTADVRAALDVRTLATIPEFQSSLTADDRANYPEMTPDYIPDHPFSAFTESFRMLHAALHRPGSANNVHQIVAITSALPGEGKSTSALCLTMVAAMAGQKALLLECDTRRLVRSTNAETSEFGLLEVLSGKVSLERALQRDAATGAYILPLSRNPLSVGDVLTTSALDHLLAKLRTMFDFIVMDTAPVLPIAETRLLVAKADAVAYLVRWGVTPKAASAAGAAIIRESGTKIAGAVLTQVDLRQQSKWTRDDASSYYKQYKNYYR